MLKALGFLIVIGPCAWAQEAAPPTAPLPNSVCIYASQIFSKGAIAHFDGVPYRCIQEADGTMAWQPLFSPTSE